MNAIPTSGPIANSRTHQARDTINSRHSFRISQDNAAFRDELRESKKNLFESFIASGRVPRFRQRSELRNCPLASNFSFTQQHETIAEALSVADLMDGK